jgi:glycosyltransferase involved in cell wall biosynthesis
MKITFDYQIFDLQEYGGISRYIYELSKELAKTEDILIVSPVYKNQYLKNAPAHLKVFGCHIRAIPNLGRVRSLLNFVISKIIAIWFRPDINHETYYANKSVALRNTKSVITVYDMIHERFSDQFPSTDPTRIQKENAVKKADHIICISEQTKKDLIELLAIDASKVTVVYLGFSLSVKKSEIKKLDYSRPYLLYVGNRDGYKNFSSLLKAYADSPTLKTNFDLICFGGGVFTENELKHIKSLALASRSVRQVSGTDSVLAAHYQSASAFIYPSLYEGFGIPPLEAMSYGCPVICSNLSSIPEVVGDAAEFFNPYDSESIRMAIERVVDDSVRSDCLIARGQERLNYFSWEKCAKETLEVYKKL